jgi:arylsulfatase A-like enzyme
MPGRQGPSLPLSARPPVYYHLVGSGTDLKAIQWRLNMRQASRWVLLLLTCLMVSCGAQEKRLNLMIIGVDTLRPDHLGCYGYGRDTSPNIDKLAGRSVLFENVVSQAPWTLPSFATMLTSLYPTQHGAGDLHSHGAGSYGTRMNTSFPPLAMMLLKQGYSTGAVVNAPALAPELGIDRGFEFYSATPRWNRRLADKTTEDALDWIDKNRENRFFIFVHYFDPHLDYEPPAPYDTLYDSGYRGRIGSSFTREDYYKMEKMLAREDDPEARAEWDHIRALYDGEIRFTDKAVGELLDGLKERGLADNTLIVFLSDHGEEFFDHGGFEHGHTLYNELIRVPLMFSLPGRLPKTMRIEEQVRILDVVPTVLEILGVKPWTHLEGASLIPLITGEGEYASGGASLLPARSAYSESMLYGTEKKSITAYPWKYIYDTITGEKLLFNLADDPGEKHNIAGAGTASEGLLNEVMTKTLLSLAETWYIEVAGGTTPHTFDITVTAQTRPINGKFTMHTFLDRDGHVVDDALMPVAGNTPNVIRLSGLELGGRVTLAFQAAPRMVPVEFNFAMDGRPADTVTYLGEDLARPGSMPFKEKGGKVGTSVGAPANRPDEPYIMVWHTGSMFEPGTQVELGEDTERQLRALGYIQ